MSLLKIKTRFNPSKREFKKYLEMLYLGTDRDIMTLDLPDFTHPGHWGEDPEGEKKGVRGEVYARVGSLIDKFSTKWIVYILNLYRVERLLWFFQEISKHEKDSSAKFLDVVKKNYPKIYPLIKNWNLNALSVNQFTPFEKAFEHSLNLPFPEIQNYPVDMAEDPQVLLRKFQQIEEVYRKKGAFLIPRKETQLEWGETLVKFDDGFQWEYLPYDHCRKESQVMEHCGRSSRGWHFLSLRQYQPALDKWIVHLTFEFEKPLGFIGEMKGQQNRKPTEHYHKYIAGLLLHKEVNLIVGGGYAPANNFAFDDFSKEFQEIVLAKKPYINDGTKLFRKQPMIAVKFVKSVTEREMNHIGKGLFCYHTFDDVHGLLEQFTGKNEGSWFKLLFSEDNNSVFDHYDVYESIYFDDLVEKLESRKPELYKRLLKTVQKQEIDWEERTLGQVIKEDAHDESSYFRWAYEEEAITKYQKQVFSLLSQYFEGGNTVVHFPNGYYQPGCLAVELGTIVEVAIKYYEEGDSDIITEFLEFERDRNLAKYLGDHRYDDYVDSDEMFDALVRNLQENLPTLKQLNKKP